MDPLSNIHSTLTCLTVNEIKNALLSKTFTSSQKWSRAKLEDAVHGLSEDAHRMLEEVAVSKKRKTEHTFTEAIEHVHDPSINNEDSFFHTVSEECWQQCVANFIDSTGNEATATSVRLCFIRL
jgi:hypothetical protein